MKNKILLIDDDVDIIASLKAILTKQGYDIITAPNGKIGYQKLTEEKPDFLILDVMMDNDLEGYNLLHTIKKNPEFRKMPIIMLTGMSNALGVNLMDGVEDEEMFPNVRFQDKPVDPDVLVGMIKEMLQE
jgi:CheY-like chemotaxis protein